MSTEYTAEGKMTSATGRDWKVTVTMTTKLVPMSPHHELDADQIAALEKLISESTGGQIDGFLVELTNGHRP